LPTGGDGWTLRATGLRRAGQIERAGSSASALTRLMDNGSMRASANREMAKEETIMQKTH